MSVSPEDIALLEAARIALVRLGERGIADPLEDFLEHVSSEPTNPCEKINCVCASVPSWPQLMGGHLIHLHADEPKILKDRDGV